jgi:hypothetical protein
MNKLNINFQPGTGYHLVHESHGNKEVWRYEQDFGLRFSGFFLSLIPTLFFVAFLLLLLAVLPARHNGKAAPDEILVGTSTTATSY